MVNTNQKFDQFKNTSYFPIELVFFCFSLPSIHPVIVPTSISLLLSCLHNHNMREFDRKNILNIV